MAIMHRIYTAGKSAAPAGHAGEYTSTREWTPMSRMDAGHSVPGLPEAQCQHADLLPLQLYEDPNLHI